LQPILEKELAHEQHEDLVVEVVHDHKKKISTHINEYILLRIEIIIGYLIILKN
jgi:hypothetical protein